MIIAVFNCLDGDLEIIEKVFIDNNDIDCAFSLGDNCLFSKSSPVDHFLRKPYRENAIKPIEFNEQGFTFSKPVFTLYGELDDPFIPAGEMGIKNIFPTWNTTINIVAHNKTNTTMKNVSIGMLCGFYNSHSFKQSNKKRNKMLRERQSLALCKDDLGSLSRGKLNFLFTHDSPLDCPEEGKGCQAITKLIEITKPTLAVFGHHRNEANIYPAIGDSVIIGVGKTDSKYLEINTFNNIFCFKSIWSKNE